MSNNVSYFVLDEIKEILENHKKELLTQVQALLDKVNERIELDKPKQEMVDAEFVEIEKEPKKKSYYKKKG